MEPKWEKVGNRMFKGRYETTIDSKGRTSLPARFRESLSGDERLVVTTGLEPCLVAYPMAAWREFEARLAALPSFDPNVVFLKRIYVSSAVECAIDGHGRILVPPPLRAHAGLLRDAVWCGMVNTAELWDATRHAEADARARAQLDDLPRALAALGL